MLKNFLARFGKGAAKVDLRFENRPYFTGDIVTGEVHIQGGEVEQKINNLSVRLMMNVTTKEGKVTREVTSIPLAGAGVISAKELRVIPFTYTIPLNLPVSRHKVSYYFDTQLDIDGGFDRTDVDYLMVDVQKPVRAIFQALEHLGFREKANSGKLDKYGQEFAFSPTGMFSGQVNEVELRFAYEDTGVYVWMEVDCRQGYQEIEAKREFFLENLVLQYETQLVKLLQQYITEAVENPYMYEQPFSYKSNSAYHGTHGSFLNGMVGGLAIGILGNMLLSEIMDSLGEMTENAAEVFGFEEDAFEENDFEDDGDDGGFFDFGDDGGFDGGDD
ncbi:hypothetical protein CD798_06620 [Bacillaceae bacterium SAOS 7]|nr:hypothetical protein CD798_06620 [Bacillaceae bacterium SAOS 7]